MYFITSSCSRGIQDSLVHLIDIWPMLQRSWWKKCHTEYKVLCSNCWNINTFSYAFVKCHKCGIPSCPKHSWQSRMRSLWKCNNPDSFFLSSGEGDTIAGHQDKNAVEKITGWIILFSFLFLFSHTVKQAWCFQAGFSLSTQRFLKTGVVNAPECWALKEPSGKECQLLLQLNQDRWVYAIVPTAYTFSLDMRRKLWTPTLFHIPF